MPENAMPQPQNSVSPMSSASVNPSTAATNPSTFLNIAEKPVLPTAPVVTPGMTTAPKDPLKPEASQAETKKISQLVNKNFWRLVLIFLVLLPVVTAVGIFGYQIFLSQIAKQQPIQQTPEIDPRLVVTPEALPTAGVAELPAGWKKYNDSIWRYSFGYPQDWSAIRGERGEVIVSSSSAEAGSFVFEVVNTPQSITNNANLANFVAEQDKQSPIRINVGTQSDAMTSTGLPLIIRYVTKGSETTQVPEAYIALEKNVLHVSAQGELASNFVVFNQLVRTVGLAVDEPIPADGTSYENTFGYSLKYPSAVILRSNDKENVDSSNISKSASILLFPISELQNPSGFSNSLALQLFDREPPQSATQSATRDFGSKEFKAYETTGQIHYVGQLPSGNWLQIAFTHNSNIEDRSLLNQVLDTIKVNEPELQP